MGAITKTYMRCVDRPEEPGMRSREVCDRCKCDFEKMIWVGDAAVKM